MTETLLEVEGLRVWFRGEGGAVSKAVDGVSFALRRGETLAIVGESGSGKSVTALSILRLVAAPPGEIAGGRICLRGRNGRMRDLLALSERRMRAIRGNEIGMIFQEPMSSLNPLMDVGEQIAEVIRLHRGLGRAAARRSAVETLERVHIPDAWKRMSDYPHQMSGGMRQRVMIAMALSCHPALLIADEPTTALDVTIQQQVLSLMREIQVELGMSILFVTHDLGVVAEIADRVAVMYAGRIVEEGDVHALFAEPLHPYTQALLHSIPARDTRARRPTRRLPAILGQVPAATHLPPGCAFAPRCPRATELCRTEFPPRETSQPGHHVHCHHWRQA